MFRFVDNNSFSMKFSSGHQLIFMGQELDAKSARRNEIQEGTVVVVEPNGQQMEIRSLLRPDNPGPLISDVNADEMVDLIVKLKDFIHAEKQVGKAEDTHS
jgi:hypothetical protein